MFYAVFLVQLNFVSIKSYYLLFIKYLFVDKNRPRDIPSDFEIKYDDQMFKPLEEEINQVPGGKMSILAVKKGSSGEIKWTFDLDKADTDVDTDIKLQCMYYV